MTSALVEKLACMPTFYRVDLIVMEKIFEVTCTNEQSLFAIETFLVCKRL